MIHALPLEHLEERYTPMWNHELQKISDFYYYPEIQLGSIEKGEFLDIEKTILFKMYQMKMIAQAFRDNRVKDGDWFFVSDIFYPGIAGIRYMAELQGIDIKIAGYNHAGRADKADFVQKLGPWSDTFERGCMEQCDILFVGSESHRGMIYDHFGPVPNVVVTGAVWSAAFVNGIWERKQKEKKQQVIFPHRLADEKGVNDFTTIAANNPELNFLVTSSGRKREVSLPSNVEYRWGLTKAQYYEALDESSHYLSCARQETFGYTLQEAYHYGCVPIVPNRLSYPEFVETEYLYNNIDQVGEMIATLKTPPFKLKREVDGNIHTMHNIMKHYNGSN